MGCPSPKLHPHELLAQAVGNRICTQRAGRLHPDDYFAAGRTPINLAEDLFAYRRARPLLLGSSIVAVVKTAESRPSDHTAKTEGVRSTGWRFLGKPEVRSVLMVVTHVIGEQSL